MNIIEKILNKILGIFTDGKDTISCKKLVGVAAWSVFLYGWLWCCKHSQQLPDGTPIYVGFASGLIGFNTFKSIVGIVAGKGANK